MRMCSNIKKKVITILINSGSTNNFLDPIVAIRIRYSMQTTNPMKVTVIDGTRITNDAL